MLLESSNRSPDRIVYPGLVKLPREPYYYKSYTLYRDGSRKIWIVSKQPWSLPLWWFDTAINNVDYHHLGIALHMLIRCIECNGVAPEYKHMILDINDPIQYKYRSAFIDNAISKIPYAKYLYDEEIDAIPDDA